MKNLNYSQIKQIDPTHTLMLRRSFEMALNKRFTLLKTIIKNEINQDNTNVVELNKKALSTIFRVSLSSDKKRIIQLSWVAKYILDVYKKGILRCRDELRNKGYDIPKISNDLLSTILELPIYFNKVELVKAHIFGSLFGIIDSMFVYVPNIDEIDNICANGLEKIKVFMKTEIMNVYSSAIEHEYQNWGVYFDGYEDGSKNGL